MPCPGIVPTRTQPPQHNSSNTYPVDHLLLLTDLRALRVRIVHVALLVEFRDLQFLLSLEFSNVPVQCLDEVVEVAVRPQAPAARYVRTASRALPYADSQTLLDAL